MSEIRFIFCVLSAFIGAGFASGREVMQFFTRFSQLAVPLILLSGAAMTLLMERCARGRGSIGFAAPAFRTLPVLLLLLCAGGGMTAAAGEIFALTLPFSHARVLGALFSLLLCLFLSLKPVGSLSVLSCLLLPLLLFTLLLCQRVPGNQSEAAAVSIPDALQGGIGALSYAGMNVMLSSGVLCAAGQSCDSVSRCRGALWAGGSMTSLLLLYHSALLPHLDALRNAALPLVLLLKGYGTLGYYLSAAVLYVSIITTLIAVLRSLRPFFQRLFPRYRLAWEGLITGLFSLVGFENIVAVCYPALGLYCFFLLICDGREKEKTTDTKKSANESRS